MKKDEAGGINPEKFEIKVNSLAFRKYRQKADFTLEDAAARIGVSTGTLWKWEVGQTPKKFNPDILRSIAELYKCDVYDLLDRDWKRAYIQLKSDIEDLLISDVPLLEKIKEIRQCLDLFSKIDTRAGFFEFVDLDHMDNPLEEFLGEK